jgi:predicted dehydrogenase
VPATPTLAAASAADSDHSTARSRRPAASSLTPVRVRRLGYRSLVASSPEVVRIGVLGSARIAPAALIRPARSGNGASVVAVAARDPDRARAFARRHGVPRVLAGYQQLVEDPGVDAVYIPLPNGLHGRWTLAALAAGKHVLCEKPFTANAEEAAVVAGAAAGSDRVVMEAFHYRYHPLASRMHEIVAGGELGELRHVEAHLCFPLPLFSNIRYNLALAGGALMDVGCYTVHLARMLGGGEPEVVSARALLHGTGIDRAIRARLRFPGGHTGTVHASMWSAGGLLRVCARVVGSAGEMRVFNPFGPHAGHRLRVRTAGGRRTETLTRRPTYAFQLDAFTGAVLRGTPFPTTAQDAVATMTVIDAIYRAAGLPVRQPTGGMPTR